MSDSRQISRRAFFAGSAAAMTGGLIVTYQVGTRMPYRPPSEDVPPDETPAPRVVTRKPVGPPGTLDAYIRVTPQDRVELSIPEVELGQRIHLALAQVLADELEARWDQISVTAMRPDPARHAPWRTEDSSSVREGYGPLRAAARSARKLLIRAAARRWSVGEDTCVATEGRVVSSASEKTATFGALAEEAGRMVAEEADLSGPPPSTFVGRSMRLDGADAPALRGRATFGLDVRRPGMLFAQVAQPAWFGAQPVRWDAVAARSLPGVVDVVRLPGKVAVVAKNTWAAAEGRRALGIEWSSADLARPSDDAVQAALARAVSQGKVIAAAGDPSRRPPKTRAVSAEFTVPFLAHAALEPLSCTAHVRADGCDVWVGTQRPYDVRALAASITGLPDSAIQVHVVAVGGSFGRRAHLDFVRDALVLAKDIGKPVQVVWSRADDIGQGRYRPAALHRLAARVDGKGWPVWWSHAIAAAEEGEGPPDLALPYALPHARTTYATVASPIPSGHWRSGAHSHYAFAVECFIDELARKANKDPLALRRRLLAEQPRHLRVLEEAATQIGYGRAPAGRAHGIGLYACSGTVVAQIAEVSLDGDRPVVHRMVCAVDCGRVINPDGVTAQMEGGMAFGLSAALYGRIRVKDGSVQEVNYHQYRVLRLKEMPQVVVSLVDSDQPPGGAGEPGVPPAAPAVVNALNRLQERPTRSLPLSV